jgi:uncharacterized membrane protein
MQSTRPVAPAPAPGGHAHGHGPVPPVSRRVRRIVAAVLVPAALATLVALVALWPPAPAAPAAADPGSPRVAAVVTSVDEQPCPPPEPGTEQPDGWQQRCGSASATLTDGAGRGGSATFALPQGSAVTLRVDDEVVLAQGADVTTGRPVYSFVDHQRSTAMIWLAGLAIVAVLAFGRWRGLASLAGLALSFGVLVLFVIPAILDGAPPLLVAVVGSAAIMFAALYLTHGVNVHTSVAVAGTLASLILTGLLGWAFTATMHLTGIGGEDTSYLAGAQAGLDLRGLLLAGIVIGALGVLDDVTVTQAFTVAELAQGRHGSRRELYRSATRVGRAHVASAVNTIVLAYAGTSLPLLLLVAVSPQPLTQMLTSEFLAQEVLRAAVGTIGLVASVPITTALATLIADRPAARGAVTSALP